jgi:hypothetical protein
MRGAGRFLLLGVFFWVTSPLSAKTFLAIGNFQFVDRTKRCAYLRSDIGSGQNQAIRPRSVTLASKRFAVRGNQSRIKVNRMGYQSVGGFAEERAIRSGSVLRPCQLRITTRSGFRSDPVASPAYLDSGEHGLCRLHFFRLFVEAIQRVEDMHARQNQRFYKSSSHE